MDEVKYIAAEHIIASAKTKSKDWTDIYLVLATDYEEVLACLTFLGAAMHPNGDLEVDMKTYNAIARNDRYDQVLTTLEANCRWAMEQRACTQLTWPLDPDCQRAVQWLKENPS